MGRTAHGNLLADRRRTIGPGARVLEAIRRIAHMAQRALHNDLRRRASRYARPRAGEEAALVVATDEPTAASTSATREKVMREIRALAAGGMVPVNTHDPNQPCARRPRLHPARRPRRIAERGGRNVLDERAARGLYWRAGLRKLNDT